MAICEIRATVECDGCGFRFSVELDPADRVARHVTVFDVVEEAVRGGGGEATDGHMQSTSVQGGKMLCETCTMNAYAEEDEP